MLDTDIELVVLEDIFNAQHCELDHRGEECLHTPVARRICKCSEKSFLICLNGVRSTYHYIHKGNPCADCKRPIRDCWDVVPL